MHSLYFHWHSHLIALCLVWFLSWVSCLCPDECRCDRDIRNRKQVICDRGNLHDLPTLRMDSDIQSLIVYPVLDSPNYLSMSRVFYRFTQIEEIHIVKSNVPAVGDGTFAGVINLRVLNLTHNNITHLVDTNFRGLNGLLGLHLDYNSVKSVPSAPFHHLSALQKLTLSHNSLSQLVPRLFLGLHNLTHLDLSGNPLRHVDYENFRDIPELRVLKLSDCQLRQLDARIFHQLPMLEVVDLSLNQLPYISQEDFRHCPRLRTLFLHGNRLTSILEKTFSGHRLDKLTLNHNKILRIDKDAFQNVVIRELDLGFNNFLINEYHFLYPIVRSLQKLEIGGNRISLAILTDLLRHLPALRHLGIPSLGYNYLPVGIFDHMQGLRLLNISLNDLADLPAQVLAPLHNIETLDLTRNQFRGLDESVLYEMDSKPRLNDLKLQGNPWSCDLCYILPVISWLKRTQAYKFVCNGSDTSNCLRCHSPLYLQGRPLHSLDLTLLHECGPDMPAPNRVISSRTQVGFIAAGSLLLVLAVSLVAVCVLYYRRGAEYYTHEEDRSSVSNQVYENHSINDDKSDLLMCDPRLGTLQKKAQLATLDTDELILDRAPNRYGDGRRC